MKTLMTRFWPTGVLIIGGFILIIYIALGFVYFQQSAKQKQLQEQIAKISAVVARPLPSTEELQKEYDDVTNNLTPKSDSDYIAILVSLAEQSGIDVSEESGKFVVPPATSSRAKVDEGTYQLISFKNILVQGDYDSVMAFISALDSGTALETMVLRKVVFNQQLVLVGGEEGDRRAEFRNVASAVKAMMTDNGLSQIPNPMNSAGGIATNLMGDDPNTVGTAEGFPDTTTTAVQKGYTGNLTPRGGYVLYKHDKISADDSAQYETVNYLTTLTTKYYYTCEANGAVRQWDGSNIITAAEYLGIEQSKIELRANVDVDIYTKR